MAGVEYAAISSLNATMQVSFDGDSGTLDSGTVATNLGAPSPVQPPDKTAGLILDAIFTLPATGTLKHCCANARSRLARRR